MSNIVNALRRHAEATPDRIVIDDGHEQLTFSQLLETAEQLASRLRRVSPRAMGLLADNGIGWVLADLAAMIASVPLVPLPPFASRAQLEHAIHSAGIDYIVTDQHARVCEVLPVGAHVALASFTRKLLGIHCPAQPSAFELPADCCKVTFTSGTTADPKGVCLSLATLERTADALREVSAGSERDRHLCVMPLATLLENVGGVYAPLLAGATILVPSLSTIGLTGSSSLDVRRLVGSLRESHATSAILVPQMLAALVAAVQAGIPAPRYLRFLAVGGAAVPPGLLEDAFALGFPVHEGYGLSECGSVVSVNRPGERRSGSVGKPLPQVRIEIASDGEIHVAGSTCIGYLGGARASEPFATGDIGHLDEDGFLYVTGRKKNMFITSFGRNVAPEWIEQELLAQSAIAQAAVFGEARAFVTAVLVASTNTPRQAVFAAVNDVNRRLPDYARIGAWVPATEAFTAQNGKLTANGRLRRDAILRDYADQIDAVYATKKVSNA